MTRFYPRYPLSLFVVLGSFIFLASANPTSPGIAIDVYLEPLVEELRGLWDVGVQAYDAFSKEVFQLRAALMWTINDFPAYANLCHGNQLSIFDKWPQILLHGTLAMVGC